MSISNLSKLTVLSSLYTKLFSSIANKFFEYCPAIVFKRHPIEERDDIPKKGNSGGLVFFNAFR